MIMKFLLFCIVFTWGYFAGKSSGMKDGYRNCHRELLRAKSEGRTHIGSSFDDFLNEENVKISLSEINDILKSLNAVYVGEYESEEM